MSQFKLMYILSSSISFRNFTKKNASTAKRSIKLFVVVEKKIADLDLTHTTLLTMGGKKKNTRQFRNAMFTYSKFKIREWPPRKR